MIFALIAYQKEFSAAFKILIAMMAKRYIKSIAIHIHPDPFNFY
jgi:hypothetical protein